MVIAIALGVIAVASVVLWLPVLMDHVNAFLAKQGSKYGWQTVAVGLALLITGLIAHVPTLAIIGGVLAGVVIAAAILDNY